VSTPAKGRATCSGGQAINRASKIARNFLLRCDIVHASLSTVVKAVRVRYAVPFVLGLVAVYSMGIHLQMLGSHAVVSIDEQMSRLIVRGQ